MSPLFASIVGSFVLGLSPARFFKVFGQTARQLLLAELTLASVLALAFTMNYSGATTTLHVRAELPQNASAWQGRILKIGLELR